MNHAIFNEENIPEELQEIDQTFRCSICGNLFDKAVSIKDCGHTYCSVCIRSHWKAVMHGIHRQPKSCPICRTILVNQHDINSALVMNRSVQESVSHCVGYMSQDWLLSLILKSESSSLKPQNPQSS